MPGVIQLNRTPGLLLLIVVATLVAVTSALAAEHSHTPVSKSEHFSFSEVFSSAYDNAPELLSSPSRQEQANQYSEAGESFFSGSPNLQGSFLDDGALDSVGLQEIESRLQFSLWRPGERGRAQALGESYQSMYESWQRNLRWEVAGRIRQVLAELQYAETMLQLQLQAVDSAEELHRLTEALYQNGSVPQLDLMQAESLLLDQRGLLIEAEAVLVDAERDYTMLTDLTVRPSADYIESLGEPSEITIDHPLLQFIQANIDVADLQVERVRRQAYGSPLLGIGVRRERATRETDYIDTLGISLSIPVGKSPTVATQVSDARRQHGDLLVVRQQTYLRLDRDLHELNHQIEVTSEKLELSRTRFELSQQRSEIARSAFELGEADLLAAILALQQEQLAERELRSQELDLQRLTIEYNQALGILP